MEFKYSASTKRGKIHEDFIKAATKKEARALLRKKGLLVIALDSKRNDMPRLKKSLNPLAGFGFISLVEKVLFTKNLSIMVKAGLPLREALEILQDQAKGKFKKIIKIMISEVEKGKRLSYSMYKYPKVFPEFYTNIVKASEESGTLESNMDYLADNLEKDWDLRRKVKSALLYPVFVLSATGIIGLSLAIFVLPKVTKLFKSFKVELPITTRILMKIAEIFQNYGGYIVASLIVGIFLFIWLIRLKIVKRMLHPLLLLIPVIGTTIENVNLARFNRTLGVLLKSGLPLDGALEITVNTLSNYVYRKELEETLKKVKKGRPLSSVLEEYEKQFPKLATRMIRVGEQSGNLDETLIYLAAYYEGEVDNTTKNLTVILEPILLVIIGVIAGGLALAIITPIYQISGSLRS